MSDRFGFKSVNKMFGYRSIILFTVFTLGLTEINFETPLDIHHALTILSPKSVEYAANIDRLIDENIEGIRSIMARMDPGKLRDVELRIILLLYMDLKNGWVQNLSFLNRAGDCALKYKNKTLTFDMNFGWKDLVFDYEYKLKLWPVPRKGDLHGQLFDLKANIAVEFDFKTYLVTLQRLEFNEASKINLKFEGHVTDKFYNLALKAATKFARTKVLKDIQKIVVKIAELEIDDINEKLGKQNLRQFTFIDRVTPNLVLDQEN